MKNILILGKKSYIGESLFLWLMQYPDKYNVNIISTLNNEWKKTNFSLYDVVVDLAGIAHINHPTVKMKELFYSVNRDLTIEIAKHAKEKKVKQFIYFSSMNVYGDYCNHITDKSKTNPTSFYGDSKLQGDIGVQKLENQNFTISILRPPFVYGRNCSGNYHKISSIAKRTPVFPDYRNKKSMIYIDNLCEFVRYVIDNNSGGYFTPQNKELVSTTDLVREIATKNRKKIWFTKLFNLIIYFGNKISPTIRRAFANDYYDLSLSNDFNFKYCVVSFKDSIKRTENVNL